MSSDNIEQKMAVGRPLQFPSIYVSLPNECYVGIRYVKSIRMIQGRNPAMPGQRPISAAFI